jgi:hypothetical protein
LETFFETYLQLNIQCDIIKSLITPPWKIEYQAWINCMCSCKTYENISLCLRAD